MRQATKKQQEPRYSLRGATEPAGGLSPALPSINIRTRVGAVPNPYDPSRRTLARVNTRVDLLESELSRGHISQAAYDRGRRLQGGFERLARVGFSGGGLEPSSGSGNPQAAAERKIVRGLEAAEAAQSDLARCEKLIGGLGAQYVRLFLADGRSYRDVAGGVTAPDRRVSFVAERFRQMLEDLAEHWEVARGRSR